MDPHKPQDDDKEFVTWREFVSELKAFRMETRLLLVIGFGALNFHLPDVVTLGSAATVLGAVAVKSFIAR